MGVIRIFANGTELDYVKDTLTIKKENNAFITDFKVTHSSFPFLIIENEKTRSALGTRDITSVRKQKLIPVVVIEMDNSYYGELVVLSYLPGYRKCDLRYGSEVLKILNQKLSDLLPVISVIPGETDPIPFTEESIGIPLGSFHWEEFPLQFINKIYPEAKMQFPTLAWKDKFGENLEPEDDWFFYEDIYNNYPNGYFFVNEFEVDDMELTVRNCNVPSPQLFLLAILDYAFATIGYKINGDFVNHDFIRRLIVLSTKDNLCRIPVSVGTEDYDFDDFESEELPVQYPNHDGFCLNFVAESEGDYTFKYKIQEILQPGGLWQSAVSALIYTIGTEFNFSTPSTFIYSNFNDDDTTLFEGEFVVPITDEQIGETIKITWLRHESLSYEPPVFEVSWMPEVKDFYQMHPTIPLGRYCPDWSLSNFINEVKKLFCLDIVFDDVSKIVTFNFTDNFINSALKVVIEKSLAISDYSPSEYIAMILRYENEEDEFLFIDKTGIEVGRDSTSEFVNKIVSNFKVVPHTGYTSEISKTGDKDGVGLMIYNPFPSEDFTIPLTSADYNGQTLTITGSSGIYETFWKKTIQIRLNASSLEIEGPFTEIEISKIDKLRKIHIDNQTYVVTSMEYQETLQDNYMVKFSLESVNF